MVRPDRGYREAIERQGRGHSGAGEGSYRGNTEAIEVRPDRGHSEARERQERGWGGVI